MFNVSKMYDDVTGIHRESEATDSVDGGFTKGFQECLVKLQIQRKWG